MADNFTKIPHSFYLGDNLQTLLASDANNPISHTSLFFILVTSPKISNFSGFGFFSPFEITTIFLGLPFTQEKYSRVLTALNYLQDINLIKFDERTGALSIPLKVLFYTGSQPNPQDKKIKSVKEAVLELPEKYKNFTISCIGNNLGLEISPCHTPTEALTVEKTSPYQALHDGFISPSNNTNKPLSSPTKALNKGLIRASTDKDKDIDTEKDKNPTPPSTTPLKVENPKNDLSSTSSTNISSSTSTTIPVKSNPELKSYDFINDPNLTLDQKLEKLGTHAKEDYLKLCKQKEALNKPSPELMASYLKPLDRDPKYMNNQHPTKVPHITLKQSSQSQLNEILQKSAKLVNGNNPIIEEPTVKTSSLAEQESTVKTIPIAEQVPTEQVVSQQEPTQTKKSRKNEQAARPDNVTEQVWNDYLQVRKDKGAKSFSITALNKLLQQADQAGLSLQQVLETCIENNWRGFNATWLTEDQLRNIKHPHKPTWVDPKNDQEPEIPNADQADLALFENMFMQEVG